jgi:Carboxypeptidase regulatory-like domain
MNMCRALLRKRGHQCARGVSLVVVLVVSLITGCRSIGTELGPVAGPGAEDGCYPTTLQHNRRRPVAPRTGDLSAGLGAVSGGVADMGSGFGVPLVRVRLRPLSDSTTTQTETDSLGGFVLRNIPPGSYVLALLKELHRPVFDTIDVQADFVVTRHYRMQAYSHCR